MSDANDEVRLVFLSEAREIIEELESALLQLEESPEDTDAVNRVFRAMHTLKGSGAMFSFDDIAGFTHEIETYYDLVRSGKLPVSRMLLDLTFESLDQIGAMLDKCTGGQGHDESAARGILDGFRELAAESGCLDAPAKEEPAEDGGVQSCCTAPAEENGLVTYAVGFRPPADVMLNGTNPLGLIDELCDIGECRVEADTNGIPRLEDIDPEKCYAGWDIVLKTGKCIDEVRDVFIFVEDGSEISVKRIKGLCYKDDETGHKLIGDILVEKGEATPEAVSAALSGRKRLGEMLIDMGEVTEEGLRSALDEQKALDSKWMAKPSASIRVASDKLDVLADLVGEMVTTQARLRRVAASISDAELTSVSEEMEKLTETLRENALGMRMVRFGTTFTKFKRLVRDLSRELGKDVDFVTAGGETELDKTVIERLNDPIMHLLRNSIDHGIEEPPERIRAGKHARGRVSLEAAHSGGNVIIRVRDDGRGLDARQIRSVAVKKGLIGPDERPSEQELFSLAMSAGFSTASSVSNVSGRGVGMDVVRKAIESLRGSVEVNSTGRFGATITLVLPLTLAIIEGLLVKVESKEYVIPLNIKCECMERMNKNAALDGVGNFMNVRGELVPCVRLREFFGLGGRPPEIEHVVVMEDGDMKAGLVVDEVVGEHQAVIKPLSRVFSGAEGVSGATILGDGKVALILDTAEVVRITQANGGQSSWAA